MKSLLLVALLALAGAIPLAAHAMPSSALVVRGQVLEEQDVNSYTYLRLKTKDGEQWAAVSRAPVKKGAEVTIRNAVILAFAAARWRCMWSRSYPGQAWLLSEPGMWEEQ